MNWEKASAFAEIFSSIAILVTLVYLTLEIEQNVEATQAETRQAMLASDQQFLELLVEDPELDLLRYQPELSDEERVRLSYFLVTMLRMRENNWLQYTNGTLDERTWQTYRGTLAAVFLAHQPRKWWDAFGVERVFDDRFVALVDELIADQPLFERSPHVAAFD